jgi:hypothetical protein
MVERRVSKGLEFDVVHETTNDSIINSGAFYSAELHRSAAQVPFVDVDPGQWIIAVQTGLANWKETVKKNDENKEKKRQREKDKLLASQTGQPAAKKRTTQKKTPHSLNHKLLWLAHRILN